MFLSLLVSSFMFPIIVSDIEWAQAFYNLKW